ncbi:hypothetical protein BGZ76_002115, partial [Entomortierella beljakovae]
MADNPFDNANTEHRIQSQEENEQHQEEEQQTSSTNVQQNDSNISTNANEASSPGHKQNLSFAVEAMQDMDERDANAEEVDSPAILTEVLTSNTEGYSIYSNIKDGKASVEHQIEIN